MSSPLRRHFKHFAGSFKNFYYRLYPQGVSSPQLIDSSGTRLTDEDYCINYSMEEKIDILNNNINSTSNKSLIHNNDLIRKKKEYCKNNGKCYSTNNGPKCDCTFIEFIGKLCEKSKKKFLFY